MDEEEDRARNKYVGPRSLSFFEDLRAEVESLIDEGLITLNGINQHRADNYHIYRAHYRQDIDDRLSFGTIVILYSFAADAPPELSVYHNTPEPHSDDHIQLCFPLSNKFVQENLKQCFRAWIAQALTLPLGWRKVRFNAYLQGLIQRHALSHRALDRLPENIISYILDSYVNE